MSKYVCDGCGETFDLLSRKRLHDCPGGARFGETGPPTADLDVSDMNREEIVERAVEELLICDVCGESSDGASDMERSMDESGRGALSVTFDCDYCGAHNENSAVLE